STFKVSPVVQEIVMQKNEDLLGDTKVLFDRLNELLLFDANTGNLENISFKAAILLVYYAENIINSIPAKDDNISMLCERVGKYFETTGDLMNALTYFEHSAELDAISLESDPSNPTFKNYLAISLSRLGSTHSYLGNLEKALEYFEKYTRLEKEL
ncbi:MAG: tetratricopeptide repeat protein, partial [Bacteroidota bacterium]